MQNGSPRKTVDMQRLNDASLCQTHPVLSPYQKTMNVPQGSYKTVTQRFYELTAHVQNVDRKVDDRML